MRAIVVHVDHIFAVGEKAKCDQFGRTFDQTVPGQEDGRVALVVGVSS